MPLENDLNRNEENVNVKIDDKNKTEKKESNDNEEGTIGNIINCAMCTFTFSLL